MSTSTQQADKLAELLRHRDAAVRTINQIDAALEKTGKRTSQRSLMRDRRRAEMTIEIGQCSNPQRRADALTDPERFCKTYGKHIFFNPFSDTHREIMAAIISGATHGGDQAIAAPRGEGKTMITVFMILYLILRQSITFPVLVAQTGPLAKELFDMVKAEFEFNDLLAADFPEISDPVRALEGAPQRAAMQRASHDDRLTKIVWRADEVVFPTVIGPGWTNYGRVTIKHAGLDGAIRGLNKQGRRPDFVLIDDPETRESAASPHQIAVRQIIIERDLAGLGGQSRRASRVMLCTTQNTYCLAYTYTDPKQRPSWSGKRFKALIAWPDNTALWDEYILKRHEDQERGDKTGATATAYYLANRAAMDQGAIVSNPYRFDPAIEVSALQNCYNYIADTNGIESFLAELQNDPQSAIDQETIGLTAGTVASRISGLDQYILPADTVEVTAAIDIGKSWCHWAAIAWDEMCAGTVFDYGIQEVPIASTPEAIERAIYRALMDFRDSMLAMPRVPSLVMVDSGAWTSVVYEFIRQSNQPFVAAKGVGGGMFHHGKQSPTRIVGQNWHGTLQAAENVWLYEFNTDEWKSFVHQRFLTPVMNEANQRRAGSMALFIPPKSDPRRHTAFAHHIVAEELREEFIPGKGLKRWWHKINKNNHWLDVLAMNCVAANMRGIRLPMGQGRAVSPNAPTNRLKVLQDAPRSPVRLDPDVPFLASRRKHDG